MVFPRLHACGNKGGDVPFSLPCHHAGGSSAAGRIIRSIHSMQGDFKSHTARSLRWHGDGVIARSCGDMGFCTGSGFVAVEDGAGSKHCR